MIDTKPAPSDGYKVLVVEDDFVASQIVRVILKDLGCEVDLAKDGEEALDLVTKNDYDLIFMDIGLPTEDGYQVTRNIRTHENTIGRYTPICALSAHFDNDSKKDALKAGMNFFLSKPLKQDQAKETLDTFVPYKNKDIGELDIPEEDGKITGDVIDMALGVELSGGDQDRACEVLKLFHESLVEDEKIMFVAFEGKDWPELHRIVHKLSGGIYSCGLPRLIAATKQLSNCLRKKNYKEINRLYAQFCCEAEAFKKMVKFLR